MIKSFITLLSGFIFALGLGISGMIYPQKVISFLDLFGNWDPSLAFVMIGAIGVHLIGYKFISKKSKSILGSDFKVPSNKNPIDKKLIIGSSLFGIGWGLGGFCPGPALVSAVGLSQETLFFILFMIIGSFITKLPIFTKSLNT